MGVFEWCFALIADMVGRLDGNQTFTKGLLKRSISAQATPGKSVACAACGKIKVEEAFPTAQLAPFWCHRGKGMLCMSFNALPSRTGRAATRKLV